MWCVRLSDSQREALRELLGEQKELTGSQSGAGFYTYEPKPAQAQG